MNEPPDGKPRSRSWLGRVVRKLSGEPGEPRDRAALIRTVREAERRDVLGPDALAMIEGRSRSATCRSATSWCRVRRWW